MMSANRATVGRPAFAATSHRARIRYGCSDPFNPVRPQCVAVVTNPCHAGTLARSPAVVTVSTAPADT
jgi:hypothetical protein